MKNLVFILYASSFIWLLPPIRQYKSKYFIYFLMLPLAEFASLVIAHYFHSNPMFAFNFASLVALISLIEKRFVSNIWPVVILVALYFSGFFSNGFSNEVIFIILHILTLAVFMKQFAIKIFREEVFSIFLVVLIFYELTLITKFINMLTGFTTANYYFAITSIFELIVGIFFSVFRADNDKILIRIKRAVS